MSSWSFSGNADWTTFTEEVTITPTPRPASSSPGTNARTSDPSCASNGSSTSPATVSTKPARIQTACGRRCASRPAAIDEARMPIVAGVSTNPVWIGLKPRASWRYTETTNDNPWRIIHCAPCVTRPRSATRSRNIRIAKQRLLALSLAPCNVTEEQAQGDEAQKHEQPDRRQATGPHERGAANDHRDVGGQTPAIGARGEDPNNEEEQTRTRVHGTDHVERRTAVLELRAPCDAADEPDDQQNHRYLDEEGDAPTRRAG